MNRSNAHGKYRNIFSSCFKALEELQNLFRPMNTAKYLIVIFFGENYPHYLERSSETVARKDVLNIIEMHQMTENVVNNLYDRIKESFIHLILIGYDVKKKTKKNKFLKLASVAKRYLLIDLMVKSKPEEILAEISEFV